MSADPTLPVLVHQLLEASAERWADRVALVDGESELTYADADTAAHRTASVLVEHGVQPGDRVALLASNSAFYVTSYYGILKAGAVAVPLSATSRPDDLAFCLDNCGATALVLGTSCERQVGPALSQHLLIRTIFSEAASRLVESARDAGAGVVDLSTSAAIVMARSSRAPRSIEPDDLASIIYTSGSTGRPRGVMLSHANIVANARSIITYLELTERDRVLALLPFSYVFGKSLLNTHVAVGGSLVIENRFMYPTVAVDTLQRTACTGLPGVPSTFQILLNKTDLANRDLPALRYACQAGGAMSPATTRRLIDALRDTEIFVMYGCTEASARLAYLPPDDLVDHIGKIGKAIPGVHIDVLREDGTPADVDEIGELVARGPNIMRGYWGDPEQTAAALDQHGLHTGDLAVRDESGYLTIVGRKGDMIKSGGHRVSPLEIEAVISEHPAVADVAVIGRPDELLGESIVAVVVPVDPALHDPEVLRDMVRSHAAERLPRHKVPTDVIVQPSLPVSEAGKILRKTLRDDVAR